MITIIHGDDTASSRKYFLDEKQKYPTAIIIDGEKVTITDLTQIFEGGGLFSENKTIFIEQIFSRKKKKDEFAILAEYLQKNATSHTVFLWEGKELERSSLSLFKLATPRVFKLPQTLFLFLDNLKPGNSKQLLSLFHQTLESTEPEMIFFMIIRQLRLLLAVSSPTDEPIDEIKRLAPWQKSKLQNQAALFKKEKLQELYSKFFAIEVGQKTGNLSTPLVSTIDFLLLEI